MARFYVTGQFVVEAIDRESAENFVQNAVEGHGLFSSLAGNPLDCELIETDDVNAEPTDDSDFYPDDPPNVQ